MQTHHLENLQKLADGLRAVPGNQFDMGSYQEINDTDTFRKYHPEFERELINSGTFIDDADIEDNFDDFEDYLLECFHENPSFQIQHGCGTSGCALGWAPALVEVGREVESFGQYSVRVFGIGATDSRWDFMFGGEWSGRENTPNATADRIEYVIKHKATSSGWQRGEDAALDTEPYFG